MIANLENLLLANDFNHSKRRMTLLIQNRSCQSGAADKPHQWKTTRRVITYQRLTKATKHLHLAAVEAEPPIRRRLDKTRGSQRCSKRHCPGQTTTQQSVKTGGELIAARSSGGGAVHTDRSRGAYSTRDTEAMT